MDPKRTPLRVLLVVLFSLGCVHRDSNTAVDPPPVGEGETARILKARDALGPLHRKKGEPAPGDWLDRFDEPGQTFEEYIACDPVRPSPSRGKLYILLLGDFTKAQRGIVEKTAVFMGQYFALPVTFSEPLGLEVIPPSAQRRHPSWGMHQLHAGYILDEVLRPRVPEDAVALIAFTASDLWPRKGWNFVFGMASIYQRVGVWSIYRNGDPEGDAAEKALCLLRTIGTGTHETGHMLSMRHCTRYECNMNGSNSRIESDKTPLALCPECAAKIWWACACDPIERYGNLEAFCTENGLTREAEFYRKSRETIAPLFSPR